MKSMKRVLTGLLAIALGYSVALCQECHGDKHGTPKWTVVGVSNRLTRSRLRAMLDQAGGASLRLRGATYSSSPAHAADFVGSRKNIRLVSSAHPIRIFARNGHVWEGRRILKIVEHSILRSGADGVIILSRNLPTPARRLDTASHRGWFE